MSGKRELFANRIVGYTTKSAADLVANPLNFRKHPGKQREAVQASLRELGWIAAVVENVTTGKLIDGHLRVEEAARRGEEVPVLQVALTEAEERLALATYDPITYMAETDAETLTALLHEVNTGEAALQELLAGLAEDAGIVTAEPVRDVEPQVDRAEELRRKWGVEPGQLWQLGEHRLLCGDCTDAEQVQQVIRNAAISAVVTDPPYGIEFGYDRHDDDPAMWFDLMNRVVPNLRSIAPFVVMPSCGINKLPWWYANHAPDWLMCWYKGSPGHLSKIGFNDWEAHLVWGRPPRQMHDYWQTQCGFDANGHPCPKPVEYSVWLVERAALRGDCIYEPFSGSGTTLMACEQLKRRCYAMEISPGYVAVALERWATATGKTPTRIDADDAR